MVLAGARIYNDGVGINLDAEEKIRQIVTAIKAISPSSEASMRLLKNLYARVKHEYLKAWKYSSGQSASRESDSSNNSDLLAMAG